MASTPVDPLQMLQSALTLPANSPEQADSLTSLREHLEFHPGPIRVLVSTFFSTVVRAPDSLFKRWVIELFQFGIARAEISVEQKTQMCSQTLDLLVPLLEDPSPIIIKLVIQCMTSVYPLLFQHLCTNRNNPSAWSTLTTCKARILELLGVETVPLSIKLPAVKFLQRVILVQTRSLTDPRLQKKNDPNIAACPVDHPFIFAVKLEAEGQKLLEMIISQIYSIRIVDLLTAYVNIWATISKLRPGLVPFIVATLSQWSPAALSGLPASNIKSVEKAVRILLSHIARVPANAAVVGQINEALAVQAARMERAAIEEKKRKAAAQLAPASNIDTRKRSTPDPFTSEAKRPKLELEASPTPTSSAAFLASFNFTTLPAALITELIVANLDAFSEETINELVKTFRQSKGLVIEPSTTPAAAHNTPPPQQPIASTSHSLPSFTSAPIVKVEPVDPLQMDIDQEEMEFEPDRLNEELSGPLARDDDYNAPITDLTLIDFKLPPPSSSRTGLVEESVLRIWDGAEEMRAASHDANIDMWMLLVVRMITRVVIPPQPGEEDAITKEETEKAAELRYEKQDQLRRMLADYIMSDFSSRIRIATTWMNEEWYNDQIRIAQDTDWRPNYETWLNQIVVSYQTLLEGKDRMFARFLLDLPSVPPDVLNLLRDLCVEEESPDRMQVGFTTLRGFVIQRPSLRDKALDILLELTTHPEKKIRGAAINTVKLWVSNRLLMDEIRDFALQMLKRLQLHTTQSRASTMPEPSDPSPEKDVDMVDGDTTVTTPVVQPEVEASPSVDVRMDTDTFTEEKLAEKEYQTPYLPESVELPAQQGQVLQHVELLFALCVKVPDFLDAIFEAYAHMDESVQKALQELLTPLIRSLGSSHAKLLTLMRTCPHGAESLALRVLTIFSESGRPSSQLVAPVKALISERNLDARFLIPIITEMDKPDIMRHIPRIVSILNGEAEHKNLVRSVFSSIVTSPPQTFGSVTSNMPRVRQSELLSPAELMVLLHESEKEIGLKSAIEAMGICFSMTDVYRSEILAVVMQQIMDKPVLPVLFMRTVIQAVKTYKSLVGFVSTTLLSRLITKKIWTNPHLWEGFIRCAQVIAPASFGALLQLPKEQLRQLVDKQPSLKAGLRDHVTKKATNKSRVAGFLDIFGPEEAPADETPAPQPATPEPAIAGEM